MVNILLAFTILLLVGAIGEKEKDTATRNLIAFIISLILTVVVYLAE